MGAPNYITDNKGNIVYPRTLAKCVKKGGTTLDDYLDKVEDNLLIKPTESGTEMMLTDSSDMNIQELHLYGKTEQASTTGVNLFDINDRLSFNSIFKVDEEGYITATIPANNTEDYQYYNFFTKKSNLVKANTNYLIICEVVKMPTTKCSIRLTSVDKSTPGQIDGNVTISGKASGLEINLMKTKSDMSDSESFTRGYFSTSPGFTENQIKFRVSVLEDTSITADTFKYEPYTGGMPSPNPDYPQEIESVENPSVIVTGKNLLVNNAKSKQIRNLIYTVNEDKSISVKGTYEVGKDVTESDIYLFGTFNDEGQYVYIPKGRYSINTISVPNGTYIAREKTKGSIINSENIIKTLSEQDCYFYSWVFRITKDGTYNSTIYPQMEVGNTATEYEPYKEIQSAQQTCELSGIGDVKDELIVRADGTGQLIQRISEEKFKFKGFSESADCPGRYVKINCLKNNYKKSVKGFCNIASYSDWGTPKDNSWIFGITQRNMYLAPPKNENYTLNELNEYLADIEIAIIAQLEEPIVTDLTVEEVQKLLALHTNKPNTTIWNDQNAEMQITYVADTKKYIDDKFEELSEAITTSTTINSLDTSN